MVPRKHGGFPHLALFRFAIAQQGVDPIVFPVHLAGQSHAHGGGNSLAQRARAHVHSGGALHIGMALQMAVELAQRPEVLPREIPLVRQNGIQRGAGMALTEHEAVPFFPARVGGVHLHYIIIERHQHLHARQRAARMAGFCEIRHLHDVGPQLLCFFLLQCKFHFLILRSLFSHGSA